MYAPVVGIATATASESDAETLSPDAALTAQGLFVRSTLAPGPTNTITVTLRDDSADTAVFCTISGSATSCTSGASSAAIAAGSRLSLELTAVGVIPPVSLLVGWQAA